MGAAGAREASTMEGGGASSSAPCAALVEFAVRGDLRFLSHHDVLRLLTRAAVRAGWPLAYSRGFNPTPLVNLPFPRNLGVASECELGVMELCEPRGAGALLSSLRETIPAPCSVHRVKTTALRRMPRARAASYRVPLGACDIEAAGEKCAALLARETILVERDSGPKKPVRRVDIRPYLESIQVSNGSLRLRVSVCNQQTARPAEILTELGLAAADANGVCRESVEWDISLEGPEDGPSGLKGNHIGHEEDQESHEGESDA